MSHCLFLADATHPVHELLDVSSFEVFLLKVAGAVLILIGTAVASWLLRRYLTRRLELSGQGGDAVVAGYRRFFTVAVWVIGLAFALHALGLDLTHAFTAGGLLAVALAFALKTLAENLVAGLILRAEHVIRTGDVLVLKEGRLVRVERMGMRATTVRTKQEQDLILPNSHLVQSEVVNCTRNDRLCRIDETVSVAYDSDLDKVRATLDDALAGLDWAFEQKPPQVRLENFGAGAVDYRVLVWMEDPWHAGSRKAELIQVIWVALKEAEITIPFPQLDVHLPASGTSTGA